MILWQDTTDQETDGAASEGIEWLSGEFWLDLLVRKGATVVALIIGALVLRYVLHKVIDGLANRAAADYEPPKRILGSKRLAHAVNNNGVMTSERRDERALTLGSLFKSVSTAVIYGIVLVMILDTLGVAVGPILASAGILGVALGFGAQNLVRDFLSGVMMTLEDQFGVGDVIDIGEAIGTVESVGLRVTRIRSVDGTLWHVRNGEVIRVGNFGQEWSRALLDVSVAYGENIARVRELLKEVADEMAADPDWGPMILDEPAIWGVQSLSADSVDVRVVIKTAPLQQWAVSRQLNERIKARFDAEGIEIPFPQRTVWHRTAEDHQPAAAGGPAAPQPSEKNQPDEN